jgi:hypothetical protein
MHPPYFVTRNRDCSGKKSKRPKAAVFPTLHTPLGTSLSICNANSSNIDKDSIHSDESRLCARKEHWIGAFTRAHLKQGVFPACTKASSPHTRAFAGS